MFFILSICTRKIGLALSAPEHRSRQLLKSPMAAEVRGINKLNPQKK